MLHKKFELVKETDWEKTCKLMRNHHTMTLYSKNENGRIEKILLTHGNENGTVSKELDLPALLYDSFDYVLCCYPKQVKTFYQIKYGKSIPVLFESWDKIVWYFLSKRGEKMFLEVSDSKNMRVELQTTEELDFS